MLVFPRDCEAERVLLTALRQSNTGRQYAA